MGLTSDRNNPDLGYGVDNEPSGMNKSYLVLSQDELDKGFVRPVRLSYIHTTCGAETTMALKIAETYARNPGFYGSTYCVKCQMHRPVGENGEFVWTDTDQKVGT